MLLSCPNCRSGLAVPDGTTAMVRCPACKTVFSAAENTVEEVEEVDEEEDRRERPRRSSRSEERADDDDDDDDRPRRKRRSRWDREDREGEDESEPENRDFDPIDEEREKKRRKKRQRDFDEKMSPEERDALRRAFDRAAWGCKLISASFGLYITSMFFIVAFLVMAAIPKVGGNPGFIIAAGAIGAVGWVLGAVGVGLALSGPPGSGHWGYGITAAAMTALHLIFLIILASQGREFSNSGGDHGAAANWGLVPTRLDAVTFYLSVLVYHDQEFVPKGQFGLSIVVGLIELLRTTLIIMLLSCLAEAAGDKDLSRSCTRAAGFTSFGPGFMALGMFVLMVILVETRAGFNTFSLVIIVTTLMGTYVILAGCMLPGLMAAKETGAACDAPFQSQLPQL